MALDKRTVQVLRQRAGLVDDRRTGCQQSVLERRPEIGLRRAVGASCRANAAQFRLETAGLGLIGGVVGSIAGVRVTATTSLVKSGFVILDPMVLAGGPLVGEVTGLGPVSKSVTATR
ncbi:FtsX-like permease family protein [Micromonospora ureilytica]|uniref:FtsX-like permease family protein n=1 Tax=Micromonospora ureilytica TaxID=709868 RepID=UPI004039B0BA